jgi:GNAT superfamily N-acetyltransferase
MAVRVARIDGRWRDLARWCDIYGQGRSAESGGEVAVRGLPAGAACFAAWIGAELVGAATAGPDGETDVFARIYVAGPARRRGAGRSLAHAVMEWSRERGRGVVKATVVAGGPGEAFADALGAEAVIRLVTVAHKLAAPPAVRPLPPGVRRLRWTNETPAVHLEQYATLRQVVGDAPDAAEQFDAAARTGQWVRAWERERTASGHQLWVSAAWDGSTLIGFTEAEVPEPGGASQHDTAVLPAWRGRGVASWLKADMIERLRAERPAVDQLTSTINALNTPMLAVCARLGFEELWRRLLVACPLGTPPAR